MPPRAWPPRVNRDAIQWPKDKTNLTPPRRRIYPKRRLRRLCEAQNHRCCYCGIEMVWVMDHRHSPTIEHVVPLSKGGPRSWANEVAACYRCNAGRKIKDPLEYLFQHHCGMSSQQWRNWNSRDRKDRRAEVLKATFARLGVPTDETGHPHPSLRDCWPQPKMPPKTAAATRTEEWARAAATGIL